MWFLKKNEQISLVKLAYQETITMMELGHQMFKMVTEVLIEDTKQGKLDKIQKMDKKINRYHRDVRKKIYEHLSISHGKDLFESLVILIAVDDSERIGDYNKNIAELIEMMPKRTNFSEYDKIFKNIWNTTDNYFVKTLQAYKNDDEKLASELLKEYTENAEKCEKLIRDIMLADKKATEVRKDYIVLLLLMRYFKRLNAHLKNIASTVVNPFHRIGYSPKKKHLKKK